MTDELPEIFRGFFAGLEPLDHNASPESHYWRCFGCGPGHPSGLRVRCWRTDDGVASPIVVPKTFEGPPGTVQGGIVATYLDEVLGAAVVRALGRTAVTGEMTIRFVKPVPFEAPLLGRGRLVTDHGKYVDVEATLEAFPGAELLARATGRFFPTGRQLGSLAGR